MKTIRKSAMATLFAVALVGAAGWGSALAQDAAAAPAESTKAMPIYINGLAPGWQSWSWAKVQLGVEVKGSTRKPIKVEAEGYQALYLAHEPFSTTGYQMLRLLVQGSTLDGQANVYLLVKGKPAGPAKLVKFSNTGWTKVQIPLETLGAKDIVVDGLWVSNPGGDTMPKFYVADIALL